MTAFDPTRTTVMLPHGFDDHRRPVTQTEITHLENQVRRLHAAVTFCVVLVVGMTLITVVTLLQLGGWIRWFA